MYKSLFKTLPSILSGIYSELLDRMVTLSLILGGAAKLLFIEAIPLYILTNSVQGFQFLHILANTDFFFFCNRHPNRYKVVSHCDFSLHFPNDLRIHDVRLLSCAYWASVCPLFTFYG